MSDTDDYPEELGERRLCWLCVTDDYLMDRIAEEGEQGACDYCGVQGPTISIAAFADHVAWIMPEDSIFNDLGDSANFKKVNSIKILAYPCTKVARAAR